MVNQDAIDAIINTQTFQTALKGLNTNIRMSIERTLNTAFAQGLGISQIVSAIKKVLDINYRDAEKVVRTESHRLDELAHNQEFLDAQAQGIDTRMMLLAVLDNRTRPQSAQMDGQLSNDKGEFEYPRTGSGNWYIPGNTGNPAYDINDRERSVQVINGYSPDIRRTREDGLIPYTTYEEWAKSKGLTKNVYGQKLF